MYSQRVVAQLWGVDSKHYDLVGAHDLVVVLQTLEANLAVACLKKKRRKK